MTYQEALEHKLEFPNSYINRSNIRLFLFVVPELYADLVKWLTDFDAETFNDETAKKYSTNNRFGVYYNAVSR